VPCGWDAIATGSIIVLKTSLQLGLQNLYLMIPLLQDGDSSAMKDSEYPTLNMIVENFDGRLTESDRAILSVLLSAPKSAVFSSVAQLAELAGVHKSTVVRLANKLGFDGYPELRAKIRSEVHPDATLEYRSQQRLNSIEQGSNLNALIESEIAALNAIAETVSQAQIDIAADHLADARTIHMVGRGSAGPLVMHLDRRLRRIGFQTNVAINLQRRDLAEKFMALGAQDAVVFFAFQAPNSLPEGYEGLMEHVAEIDAKSIVISDSSGPTIRPRADVLLSVSRPDEGVMQLRTGPIVVCEALAMTLAHKDPKRAVNGLEGLEGLRANLLRDKGRL
jgi:DNA-binding MurR/RpiR family transcriptional regulator